MYYNVLLLITRYYYYGVLHSTIVYYTVLLLSISAMDVWGERLINGGWGKNNKKKNSAGIPAEYFGSLATTSEAREIFIVQTRVCSKRPSLQDVTLYYKLLVAGKLCASPFQ